MPKVRLSITVASQPANQEVRLDIQTPGVTFGLNADPGFHFIPQGQDWLTNDIRLKPDSFFMNCNALGSLIIDFELNMNGHHDVIIQSSVTRFLFLNVQAGNDNFDHRGPTDPPIKTNTLTP